MVEYHLVYTIDKRAKVKVVKNKRDLTVEVVKIVTNPKFVRLIVEPFDDRPVDEIAKELNKNPTDIKPVTIEGISKILRREAYG